MEKFAFTVEEAMEAGAIGRTKLYEAIADKRLKARKRGKRTVILADDLKAFLQSLPDYHEQAAA